MIKKHNAHILICLAIIGMLFSFSVSAQTKNIEESIKQRVPAIEYIWNWTVNNARIIWNQIYSVLDKQVEQRKPAAEEEFKKETQEIKEEIQKNGPSLWQRLMDLIH